MNGRILGKTFSHTNVFHQFKIQVVSHCMSLWLKEKKTERPIYKPSICNVFLLAFVCRYVSKTYTHSKVSDFHKSYFLECSSNYGWRSTNDWWFIFYASNASPTKPVHAKTRPNDQSYSKMGKSTCKLYFLVILGYPTKNSKFILDANGKYQTPNANGSTTSR